MHGIIITGYHDSIGSVFHSRGSGAYKIAHQCRLHQWSVDVIDYVSHWDYDTLKDLITRKITENDTKWFGISYTWIWRWPNLKPLLIHLKTNFPDLLLIAGGQTPFNEDLNCDWYILGYAEEALIKVLDYEFAEGKPLIYSKRFNGKYINAVHSYPSYNTKNYSFQYIDSDYVNESDVSFIELSRGCKFKCNYCNFPFIGIKEDTSTSEELLYRELNENYEKYGLKNYLISDDTPNDRTEKLVKLSNVVDRLDFEVNFSGFIRADLLYAHPEQIELLAKSRFWAHYYGIETFNHEAGKSVGKGQHPSKTKEILLKTKEYLIKNIKAYRGTIGLIAGLPHESVDSMEATQLWCETHWKDQSWTWWPLQITLDKDSLSAFGQNFEKFGYRPLSKKVSENKFTALNSTNNFMWENDYTNIVEMEEFCLRHVFDIETNIDAFSIISYVPFFGVEESLNFKNTVMYRYKQPLYLEKAKVKINQYIKNKCTHII